MDCRCAKKLIPAFLDGELSVEKALHLDEHLADCTACRNEMSALRATVSVLDAWTEIEPSRTYADLRARIGESPAADTRTRRLPFLRPVPRWAVAATLFIAIVGGSLSGVHRVALDMSHSHEVTAEMAQASNVLELDAFGGSLSDVLYNVRADDSGNGGVTK